MKKLVFAGITALVTVLMLGSFVLAQEGQMMRSTSGRHARCGGRV